MRQKLHAISRNEDKGIKGNSRLVDPKEISRISRDVCNEICEINRLLGFNIPPNRQALI
jgi:hypothetical protein